MKRVRPVEGVAVRRTPVAAAAEKIIDPQTGNPGARIISYARTAASRRR